MRTLFAVWPMAIRFSFVASALIVIALNVPAVAQEGGPATGQETQSESGQKSGVGASDDMDRAGGSAKKKDVPEVGDSDIYNRWSQETLRKEEGFFEKPHPLAEQHPDHYVVVCEAGCDDGVAHIVGMKQKSASQPTPGRNRGNERNNRGGDKNAITCVGGCYDGQDNIVGTSRSYDDSSDWQTTDELGATPAKPAKVNKRWYERIN